MCIRDSMREELKKMIMFTRGVGAWEELLRTEGEIRKKRQKAIYDQEERRRKLFEWIAIGFLITVVTGFVFWMFYLYLLTRGYI